MKRSEAIRILAAHSIPFIPMVDGKCSPEAVRRMRTDEVLATEGPRFGGEIVVQSTDPAIIDQLVVQGFERGVATPTIAFASIRGFDPEEEAAPAPAPVNVYPVAVKSGQGFTGEASDCLIDLQATAANYRTLLNQPLVAGGRAHHRRTLLQALRRHMEQVPGLTRGQVDRQVQLAANAVFVQVEGRFHGYESDEAYR